MINYNPWSIVALAGLLQMCQVTEKTPAKTVEYLNDVPQYSKLRVLREIFER